MSSPIKSIAVMTSGGDAPGMNAAIRAVVRASLSYGVKVYGIRRGYEGMIEGDIFPMESHSVSNIIQRGGTILKSARSDRFRTLEGRELAYAQLKKHSIDAVVAIGGDGTFTGAVQFNKEHDIPFVGIPGTIDCDLYGTDYTLGFDTAVNTAVEAIDRIRDTADSHDRLFFVEVMGRDAGFIALYSGIAGGAEATLIPESKTDENALMDMLGKGWERKKTSMIVVVAEGDEIGGAYQIAEKVKAKFNHYDIRVSVLGHMQRGGSPSCLDRVLGSRMGVASVEALLAGRVQIMIGIVNNHIHYTSFEKAIKHNQDIDMNLLRLGEILSS
ncbi:MAG: 6-phosphofructokinase [Sphingobacteriales bacterium]|nr:6-phosphofructokinase [Sphingobacteriales bacterium]